jgi:hypothetical protein
MEWLSWELDVLTRAVSYANLSGAAAHIGISQPQLSRIVAKLESELGLVLLDREERRRSGWTPSAHRLAEVYGRTFRRFKADLQQLNEHALPETLHIGTLEGLGDLAIDTCRKLFEKSPVTTIELQVLDLNEIEERFGRADLDLVFTSRTPSRKKYRNEVQIGWQTIETKPGSAGVRVLSAFEYGTELPGRKRRPTQAKTFVSNSLHLRAKWLRDFGGVGSLPSSIETKPRGKPGELPVLIIAHDDLVPSLWDTLIKCLPPKVR